MIILFVIGKQNDKHLVQDSYKKNKYFRIELKRSSLTQYIPTKSSEHNVNYPLQMNRQNEPCISARKTT